MALKAQMLTEQAEISAFASMQAKAATNAAKVGGSAYSTLGGQLINKSALTELEAGASAAIPKIKALTLDMNDAHAAARGLAGGFGQLWLTYGSVLPLVAGAALAYSFKTAIELGAKFTESLYVIQELAGNTSEEVKKLSVASMELGRTSQYGPLEVAKGMEILALAGLKASEVLVAIKPTLNFASAGGVTAEKAAETLVAVSTAYGYTADSFAAVGDVIAKTAADSMASVESMSESFRSSSIVAQQYGVTLEDMAKNLAFLSQVGIQGSSAGTSVKNFYTELAKESGKVPKALEAIGITATDSNGKMRPLLDTMQDLILATSKLDAKSQNSLFQAISNERGGKTAAAVNAGIYKNVNEFDNKRVEQEIALGEKNVKTIYQKVDALVAEGKQLEATALKSKTLEDAFKRIREEVEKTSQGTAGFNFFGDLEKKLIPLAQFKSILASLQTDFVQAFTGAEASVDGSHKAINGAQDALFLLGVQLKAIAESESFRQGVADMVVGLSRFAGFVLDASKYLYEHKEVILGAGAAYILLGANFGFVGTALLALRTGVVTLGAATASVTGLTALASAATATYGATVTGLAVGFRAAVAGMVIYTASLVSAEVAAFAATAATALFYTTIATFGLAAVAAGAAALALGVKFLIMGDDVAEANEKAAKSDIKNLEEALKANRIRVEMNEQGLEKELERYAAIALKRSEGMTQEQAVTAYMGAQTIERVRLIGTETQALKQKNYELAKGALQQKLDSLPTDQAAAIANAMAGGTEHIDNNSTRSGVEREMLDLKKNLEVELEAIGVSTSAQVVKTRNILAQVASSAAAAAAQAKKDAEAAGRSFKGTGELDLSKDKAARKVAAEGFKSLSEEEDKAYAASLKTMKQAFTQQQAAIQANFDTRKTNQGEFYAASILNQAREEQSELAALQAHDAAKRALILAGKANDKDPVAYEKERAKNLRILSDATKEATEQIKNLAAARMLASQNTLEKKLSDEAFAFHKLSLSVDEYLVQLKLKADADTAAAGATASERAGMEAAASFTAKYSDEIANQTIVIDRNRQVYQSLGVAMMDAQLANNPEAYLEIKSSFVQVGSAVEKATSELDKFKSKVTSGAATAGAGAAQKELVKEFDETNTKLKDGISNAIFDGAKAGGANLTSVLRKSIEEFAKQKFRILIDAVLNPITGALTNFINPAAGAASGMLGGGSGGMGGLNFSSMLGGANPFTDFGLSVTNSMTTLGAHIGQYSSDIGSALIQNANSVGNFASVAGDALGYAGSVMALSEGRYGAAIGSAIGTYFGGPIGSMIGSALGGLLDGKKGIASQSTGSMERSYDASGAVTSSKSPFAVGNGAAVVDGLQLVLMAAQKSLGATGGSNFAYGAYSGNDNKNPMMNISGGSFISGEIANNEENLKLASSRAVLSALMSSQLPRELEKVFNGLNPAAMDQKAIDKVYAYAQGLRELDLNLLASPFENLKNLSYDAAQGLMAASGGIEKLIPNLANYYDNFYKAEEKRARIVTQITDTLNAAGAGLTTDQVGKMSRDDFRAKFETAGNSNELNAAYIAVNSAFASVTPAAITAAASLTAVSETLKGLQKESLSLGADVLQAQGKTAEADAARRLIATAGYTQLEVAAYDYNQALREEIKTRQKATVAAEAVTAEGITLQGRLAAATDTVAEAATRARNAIAPFNQAFYDFVTAAEAAKAAVATQSGISQKYSAPLNADSAKTLLGPNFFASIEGKSAEKIREMANAYVTSLDAQTEAGRLAIANFDKLTPAIDFFATAAEGVAQRIKTASESFNANIGSTFAKLRTPEQNNANEYANIAASLKAGGFANKDNAGLLDVLKTADKARIESLAQIVFDGLGDGAVEAKEELRKLVDRLADLKNAEASAAAKVPDVVAVLAVVESVADAYKRLTEALKNNEQIAQERISLESRLYAATDTTAQALARVRAAVDPLNQALFDTVTAAEAAKTAQTAATEAAKTLAAERKTLQDQLNSLTDTSTQALARQRAALNASNQALFDQVQAQTKVNATAAEHKTLQDQLNGLTDTAVQALKRQRDALDASNQSLFDQVQAATAAKAASDASKAAASKVASDSMSALQRAVEAQRKIVQVARNVAAESVSEITSVFDILKSSVKELYGTVGSTAQMQAAQGREFISKALATAQSTGYLPESKALTEAINAAKGGTQEFASQFEKDFAALTLAGDLSLMESLSKDQLTAAQKALKAESDQLTALDDILSLAQRQLDAANGINTSVLSLKDALASFAKSLVPLANPVMAQYDSVYGKGSTSGVGVDQATSLAAGFKINLQAGYVLLDSAGGIALGINAGSSAAQVASQVANNISAFGADSANSKLLADWAKEQGIPGFAVGINRVPFDMTARIHADEAVVPAALNPFNPSARQNGMGGGTERLEALVVTLIQKIERLEAVSSEGNNYQRRTADTLENVTEGGANMRTIAA